MLHRIRRSLFPTPPTVQVPAFDAASADGPAVESVQPKVLLIVHDPPVAGEGGRRLTEIFGWHDPDGLVRQYIADLAHASHGYLRYRVVERIQADGFPAKRDGFRYTGEGYVSAWRVRSMAIRVSSCWMSPTPVSTRRASSRWCKPCLL